MGIPKTWVGRSYVFNERLEVGCAHMAFARRGGGRRRGDGCPFTWIRMDWAGSVVAVLVGCAIGDF